MESLEKDIEIYKSKFTPDLFYGYNTDGTSIITSGLFNCELSKTFKEIDEEQEIFELSKYLRRIKEGPSIKWIPIEEEKGTIVHFGRDSFTLNKKLYQIANVIRKSANILKLEEDWDEEGGQPTDYPTLYLAVKFLADYSEFIYQNYDNTVIDTPSIELLNDGAIAVNWETNISSFTIIFNKGKSDFAFYYAKSKDGSMPPLRYRINLAIKLDDLITAPWMAKYLKLDREIESHRVKYYIAGE